MSKKFKMTLTLNVDIILDQYDIFHDNFDPPTLTNFRKLVESDGGIQKVLTEWNLLCDHPDALTYEVEFYKDET